MQLRVEAGPAEGGGEPQAERPQREAALRTRQCDPPRAGREAQAQAAAEVDAERPSGRTGQPDPPVRGGHRRPEPRLQVALGVDQQGCHGVARQAGCPAGVPCHQAERGERGEHSVEPAAGRR